MTYPQQPAGGRPEDGFARQYGPPPQGAAARASSGALVPLLLGALGITGFFLGFGEFIVFKMNGEKLNVDATLTVFGMLNILFPALVLTAGLVAVVGWMLRARWGIALAAVFSMVAAAGMLTNLQTFGEDGFWSGFLAVLVDGVGSSKNNLSVSAGWGYWVIFAIAVVQFLLAAWALAGVVRGLGGLPQIGSAGPAYGFPQPGYGRRFPAAGLRSAPAVSAACRLGPGLGTRAVSAPAAPAAVAAAAAAGATGAGTADVI